jgi:hypothetical protein
VYRAFPFAERVNGSVKQRQFRCEVHVARKRYTQGPALLRQPQELFGGPMSASAHFSVDWPCQIVRHPFQIIATPIPYGGEILVSADGYFHAIKAISTALMFIRNDSLLLLNTLMRIVAVDSSQIELF